MKIHTRTETPAPSIEALLGYMQPTAERPCN
jgi:hypothetical protein